jgi:CRISPR type I-E-associated protein CasB/Cse2
MTSDEIRKAAGHLTAQLLRWADAQDRGALSGLRKGLSQTTRQYAWPLLAQFGPNAVGSITYETVAGCFALHPKHANNVGNFGRTVRGIQRKTPGARDDAMDSRFRRLLTCGGSDEICQHIRPCVKLARSKDVAIDYTRLFLDLTFWNDDTKVRWAKSYWDVPTSGDVSQREESSDGSGEAGT